MMGVGAPATSTFHLSGRATCALQDMQHCCQQLPGACHLLHWDGRPQAILLLPHELVFAAAAVHVNHTTHFISVFNLVVGLLALCRTCSTTTHGRHLPPVTPGWQAPGNLAIPPSLCNHSRGGGISHKLTSSQWWGCLHSAGHAALPPADGQEPAACDTRVAGPRQSTFSLNELIYFGEAGGGNDGSGSDSGRASCAVVLPLQSSSSLLQQAVSTRLVVVRSQSAAH